MAKSRLRRAELLADALQKGLGETHTVVFAVLVAAEFDADVTSVTRIDDDPHHLQKICPRHCPQRPSRTSAWELLI